jgi:hypothetical protein
VVGMMEQAPPARARRPKMATRAKCPDPPTTPPLVDMLERHPLRRLLGRQPSRLESWNSTSPETPAGEGIGTPKRGPSTIGPVSAIERKARVSARTDRRTSRSTWRVRAAFRTLTNMSDVLALTDGGSPIGRCFKRETSRVHNRNNRRHHEHHVPHSTPPCLASIRHPINEMRPSLCMNYQIITGCCRSATPFCVWGKHMRQLLPLLSE